MQCKKSSYKSISSCYVSPLPSQPCPDYVTWMKFINHNYSLLLFLSREVQQAKEKWVCVVNTVALVQPMLGIINERGRFAEMQLSNWQCRLVARGVTAVELVQQ